jgi:aerobic-type carbon monoxide dehydrogenase small subunit (CoxS/CutS family)
MPPQVTLAVNGKILHFQITPETPLLYILRDNLGLEGIKYGYGSEQFVAC